MEIENARELVENAIISEKKILSDNLEDLKIEQEHNMFLEDIADDYKRYQSIIIKQKEEQKNHFLKVLNYLDNLIETNAVTKHSLAHTYNEQKRLVNEIKKLQNDLDNINLD